MKTQIRLCNKCGRAHIEQHFDTRIIEDGHEYGMPLKRTEVFLHHESALPMTVFRGNHTKRTRVCLGV